MTEETTTQPTDREPINTIGLAENKVDDLETESDNPYYATPINNSQNEMDITNSDTMQLKTPTGFEIALSSRFLKVPELCGLALEMLKETKINGKKDLDYIK